MLVGASLCLIKEIAIIDCVVVTRNNLFSRTNLGPTVWDTAILK